jgi:hypothetical protein
VTYESASLQPHRLNSSNEISLKEGDGTRLIFLLRTLGHDIAKSLAFVEDLKAREPKFYEALKRFPLSPAGCITVRQ